MNIIIEKKEDPTKDCKDANILLQECLYFLNQVPNRKYRIRNREKYQNSYGLAAAVQKHLKTQEV